MTYEEGLRVIEESCGKSRDNVIALATIATDVGIEGKPYPFVREVDAHYEDGVFYITTWGKSNKVLQILQNNQVAFVVCQEGISGYGIGENLGWVLDPKNSEIREKVRYTFRQWYDHANNEQDENCVIVAIRIRQSTVFRDEGVTNITLDFEHKLVINN